MKFLLKTMVFSAIAWLSSFHTLNADIVISLDVSSAKDGIQTSESYRAGTEFDLTVSVQLDSTESIAGYGFRVRYDADEFTFISRFQNLPDGFNESDNNNNRTGNDDSRLGSGSNFNEVLVGAADFSGSAEPLRGPNRHQLATIRFRVDSPDSNGIDFAIAFNPVFDGIFDEDLNLIPESRMELGTASVVAIPEPGTISALCLVAILLTRRRRRVS